MAAHLYWRLNYTNSDGGTSLWIAELELRTAAGGANVASGGTAIGSGTTPTNAFDANLTTNYVDAAKIGYLQYQFASAQDIAEIAVTAPNATTTNAPKNMSVAWSDDGKVFTTQAIIGGQSTWGVSEQRVFTLASYPTAIGVTIAPLIQLNAQTPPTASVVCIERVKSPAKQTSPMLSGAVTQNGSPVARTVRAYCRLTGDILDEAVSDASTGVFSLNARGRADKCYVVALDDLTQSPDYNAQIVDLVTPV